MKSHISALSIAGVLLLVAGCATPPQKSTAQTSAPESATAGRERLLMDFGWRFHLGNTWGSGLNLTKAASSSGPAGEMFNDTDWRKVNLPHDWAVELPFDRNSDMAHGYKPVGPGFPTNSVAWYRRSFDLPAADAGKRLWLEFDGVYRNCDVFVNGWFVGNHQGGYDGFRYDITDVANYGSNNVVAVRVDASEFEGWFYEGAGIYRHVWLEKTAPVAIAPDGIFVWSKFENNVPKGDAQIMVRADLLKKSTNYISKVTAKFELISPEGKFLGSFKDSSWIRGNAEWATTLFGEAKFGSSELWSPESPKLYKLITTIEADGKMVDRKETEFGIRTLAFDATNGFLLNGKHYPIQGTCNHQDMAGVGAALPDALQYFRIARLKEMGCNAYRTSHNTPTPELLDACDHLGMLVLDENRLVGSDEENLRNLRGQIMRDRNHPSVFAWSLGNEEWGSQGTASGAASIRTMQELAHALDPTRLCTAAINGAYGDSGFITVLDVAGFNYNLDSIDPYHRSHTNSFIIGTETASTVTTRGIYTNDLEKGYVAAYDYITKTKGGALVNPVTWGETAEEWWTFYDARPWSSGGFAWTGFDYRGEPTPYEWPCINSHFGIMDMCGFPKDNFYYYQSVWTTNTVLHLLPHWNWPGREGREIDVRALSNCEEVELFLNGQSLGKQAMKKNSELKWMVKYAPGVLSAKGYKGGKVIAETKVETTGDPAAIQLAPDRATINADGEDVSVVKVQVNDAQNRMVPDAANDITFDISGPGKIIGVGNGDPSSHEPDIHLPVWSEHSVALNDGWRWKNVPDVRAKNLAEVQTDFDDAGWQPDDPQSGSGPLQGRDQAVFRAKIQVTAEELASENVELDFGMIDEGGWVFVNGQKVGESHDWQSSPSFDVKRFLHPGENTIAVAVDNWTGAGGINKGVHLRLQPPPVLPTWKRSVFNGLAQVIVQSTGQPGEITLTAKSQGVTGVVLQLQAQPVPHRPAVAAN
jgi:beta-galactosidase